MYKYIYIYIHIYIYTYIYIYKCVCVSVFYNILCDIWIWPFWKRKSSLFLSTFLSATTLQVLLPSWHRGTLLRQWPEFSWIQGLLKPNKNWNYKTKHYRDMGIGYEVKMRIYVILQQCMYSCAYVLVCCCAFMYEFEMMRLSWKF